MKQASCKYFTLFVGLLVLCLCGVFWLYHTNLPDRRLISTPEAQRLPSMFEKATGKQPEIVVHEIGQRFNVTLYATYGTTLSGRYTLDLGLARDCNDATACYFGDVLISSTPIITREAGTAVQLENGITAYFIDFTCGASCGASTLNWHEGAYYYQVAKKAGSQQEVIVIAEVMQRS